MLQSFGTYLNNFTPYLPQSIKKQLPITRNGTGAPHEEKDTALWCSFDHLEVYGSRFIYLIYYLYIII